MNQDMTILSESDQKWRNEIITQLSSKYRIYAPVLKKGEGRFTDTDVVLLTAGASAHESVVEQVVSAKLIFNLHQPFASAQP